MLILAARLRALRLQKKITQKTVADQLNVHKSLISAYENGGRSPSYRMLCKIADYYGTTTDYLLGRTNNRSESFQVLNNSATISDQDQQLAAALIQLIHQYQDNNRDN